MVPVIVILECLYRRIGGRGCSVCSACACAREPPVDAFLLAVALEDGIPDALADDQGSGAGCARRYAAAVFFKFGDDSGFSCKYVFGAEVAIL